MFFKMNIQHNLYKKGLLLANLLLISVNSIIAQKVVRYDLQVRDTIVTFAGKPKRAIATNGQIPMPTFVNL